MFFLSINVSLSDGFDCRTGECNESNWLFSFLVRYHILSDKPLMDRSILKVTHRRPRLHYNQGSCLLHVFVGLGVGFYETKRAEKVYKEFCLFNRALGFLCG